MIKTLCTAEFDPVWAEKMEKMTLFDRVGFSLDKDPASRMGPEEITRALQGYDVFLCGYEKVTREVLARCPDLKLILSVRDGPEENIDVAACTELGIPVYSSSGRCMRSVPEFTMLAMLLMAKPAMASASVIRREGWTAENDLKLRRICEASTELSGKTLGIIGLGRNGQGLARRAAGFEMDLIAYDPYASAETARELGVALCSLEELVSRSDYVVMLARVTPETRGMIDKTWYEKMRKGVFIVNTGRAAVFDQRDFIEALQNGTVAGAACDVSWKEPIPANHPFWSMENVLITPHIAGVTMDMRTWQSRLITEDIIRYCKGEPLENVWKRTE